MSKKISQQEWVKRQEEAEEYANQSGSDAIVAVGQSDEENAHYPPGLQDILRLVAVLRLWENEQWTDQVRQFYLYGSDPYTHWLVYCSLHVKAVLQSMKVSRREELAKDIDGHWKRISSYADDAAKAVSAKCSQFRRGDIDEQSVVEEAREQASFLRAQAQGLRSQLEKIAGQLKVKQKGLLEPKPPEFLQKLLWLLKYGWKHWKLILLAMAILLVLTICVLPKFDLLTRIYSKLSHFF